jgi:hypothetical protein
MMYPVTILMADASPYVYEPMDFRVGLGFPALVKSRWALWRR